jgi:hypothetical protein
MRVLLIGSHLSRENSKILKKDEFGIKPESSFLVFDENNHLLLKKQ